jgi:cyanophycinase
MAENQSHAPVPTGTLVIIGGSEDKGDGPKEEVPEENFTPLEVLQYFADTIQNDNPNIEVVTTASEQGEQSFKEYKKLFKKLGIVHIGHVHHNSRKDVLADNELVERVNKAEAVFFTGGDQLRLTSFYGGTVFLIRLKERYIHNKFVIGGTSAGAMALSTPMIYAGSKDVEQTAGEIKITTGMEFLKDVCIDTHFTHRGRFVRMAQVVVTNPTCIGLGVEEDTAVVVRKGREAEVIGTGTVIIIDGFHIAESNITNGPEKQSISIRDLKVQILSRGDQYFISRCNPPHV